MAKFLITILIIAIAIALINYAGYLLAESDLKWLEYDDLPVIKFDDFEKYYKINPDCWYLNKWIVERTYNEKFNSRSLRFRFPAKDYKKYRSFLKRIKKEWKDARDSDDYVKLLNLVTADIKVAREKAKENIERAEENLKT